MKIGKVSYGASLSRKSLDTHVFGFTSRCTRYVSGCLTSLIWFEARDRCWWHRL